MTYDPSMRVLTVLELLQSRERMGGPELCRRLEVSPRTVQRYVARLQDLGIPVESTRGVGGSYRLKPGFRLPPLMFSQDEALSIALGLRALRLLGLEALTPAAASASAKLARTLPHALSERVQALQDAVQLDVAPWVVAADAALLSRLLEAMEAGRVVDFGYTSRQETSTRREVEVYGTVHVFGRWYLVGHCRSRGALRSFRLDRMRELTLTGDTFTRPEGFDALAHLRASMPFEQSGFQVEVTLHAPLKVVKPQLAYWGVTLSELPGGQTQPTRTRLTARRERLEPFAAALLGLGYRLTVIGPPELRQAFAALAERSAGAAQAAAIMDAP